VGLEPFLGLGFRDDREDLDFFVGDVIEHEYLINAEAEPGSSQPAKALDSTLETLVGSCLRWVSIASLTAARSYAGRARKFTAALGAKMISKRI
jgi:hypothetical protein